MSSRWRSSSDSGSSPRVRGTRADLVAEEPARRFIPACAGNSSPSSPALRSATVHPRVCGELFSGGGQWDGEDGSSPRVRGTRSGPRARRSWRSVHPRVCGELFKRLAQPVHHRGSSPRVRGTHSVRPSKAVLLRFIPACAGNSFCAASRSTATPVHPRVYGELDGQTVLIARASGSSPRVRGTPPTVSRLLRWLRFIPACAGNSRARFCAPFRTPVHPRVCGELAKTPSEPTWNGGSSPRVRGTPGGRGEGSGEPRFIPACAGNSPAAFAACVS